MKRRTMNCSICTNELQGHGHNPYPLKYKGRACTDCNDLVVYERIKRLMPDTPDIKYIGEVNRENRRV